MSGTRNEREVQGRNRKQGSKKEAILAVMKTTYVIVKIRPEKKNSGSYGI